MTAFPAPPAARRIVYFLLGIALTIAVLAYLVLWDSYRNFKTIQGVDQLIQDQLRSEHKADLRTEDLLGTWHGKESWGIVYTITRKADGTFSETLDRRQSDAATKPAFTKSKGRWAVSGWAYAKYYTESTDPSFIKQPPNVFNLTDFTPKSFQYFEEEGNGCREQKE